MSLFASFSSLEAVDELDRLSPPTLILAEDKAEGPPPPLSLTFEEVELDELFLVLFPEIPKAEAVELEEVVFPLSFLLAAEEEEATLLVLLVPMVVAFELVVLLPGLGNEDEA